MALTIQDRDLQAAGLSEAQLRLEIALMLYQQRRFSIGRASKFANLHQVQFMREMARRRIAMNYDERALDEDVNTLGLL